MFGKYTKILGMTVGLIAIACGQASTDPPWRESLGYSTNEVFRINLNELGIPVVLARLGGRDVELRGAPLLFKTVHLGLKSGLCGGFRDSFK